MAYPPLGIGVIGAGNIIKRHALAYHALPGSARLIGVADVDLARATSAKKRYGFDNAFDDSRKLFDRDDVDVIDVCTPPNHHAGMVIDALRAGKHVLCEKPMATTLTEADDIIRAADEHPGRTASFVFQLRSESTHRRVRRMIVDGRIGRPLLAHLSVRLRKKRSYYSEVPSRGSWKTDGGGVLVNQAIHQLDALISFLGDPVAVSAAMDTFVQPMEAEDAIVGWVKFSGGAFATIECTVCAHDKSFSIDVLGEKAGVSLGGDPDARSYDWGIKTADGAALRTLKSQALRECPSPRSPAPWTVAAQKLISSIRRRPWVPPAHWGHAPFIREFLTAAQTGSPGPMPPREARRSLEVVMAFYQSAVTQRTVGLPLDATSSVYRGVDVKNIGGDSPSPPNLAPRAEAVPAKPEARAESGVT